MNKTGIQWKPTPNGCVGGRRGFVISMREQGGAILVQCKDSKGRNAWSWFVSTIESGKLLAEIMIREGKDQKDLKSVYFAHVQKIDSPKAARKRERAQA